MYILIDRGQMAITHKHNDREVLAKLSWIECTNAGVTMSLSNIKPLLEFSHSELLLIYKNATGADLKGYSTSVAQAILDAARRMPESAAILAEVTAQALCIEDGDKSSYRYLLGSMKPEELPGLYGAFPISVERSEAEELRANSQAHTQALPGAGPANFAAGTTAAAQHIRAPAAPRVGGTRETIFRVADEMWAAIGSPTDKQRVLELRKQIMAELETHHEVKKTTSSTALGDWQKQRIS